MEIILFIGIQATGKSSFFRERFFRTHVRVNLDMLKTRHREKLLVDYFRWRQEDATRNALNAHCYWLLRKEGKSVSDATNSLLGLSVSQKNELLFKRGVNFGRVSNWQKRGVGVYWEQYEKEGFNPKTGKATKAMRQRLNVDLELPMKGQYEEFIRKRMGSGSMKAT